MPKQFDLKVLADKLRSDSRHRKFVGTLDRWLDRNSRFADLKHSRALLAHIMTIRESRASFAELSLNQSFSGDLEGALFAQAILLYARGASDGDRGRRYGLGLTRSLNQSQMLLHKELIQLRKTAIAHVDGEDRQTWSRDRVILIEHANGDWQYGFPFYRTFMNTKVLLGFVQLLDAILPTLADALKQENDCVHDALCQAIALDAGVRESLERSEFDASSFYGGALTAEQFLTIIAEPNVRWSTTAELPAKA